MYDGILPDRMWIYDRHQTVGMPLYKGVIMTGTKFLLGVIVGLVVGKICGPEGFLGIAPLY